MQCPKCGLIKITEISPICDCGYAFETKPQREAVPASLAKTDHYLSQWGQEFVLASLRERLAGKLLDGLFAVCIVLMGFIPIAFIRMGLVEIPVIEERMGVITAIFVFQFNQILMAIFYLLFSDGFHGGQSLGKEIRGTAVVDVISGKPCSLVRSFCRNLSLMVLVVIDWIFILDKKRQRIGDKVAGTVVVKKSWQSEPHECSLGGEYILASLGRRLAARLIDSVVCVFLIMLQATRSTKGQIFLNLLPFIYVLLADGIGGQSIGKRILSIIAIDASSGVPCSYRQSVYRNLTLVLPVIDWVWIFGKKRQRIGDKAAGTVVVNEL